MMMNKTQQQATLSAEQLIARPVTKYDDSRKCSIHELITLDNKNYLREGEVKNLFINPKFSSFDLSSLQSHPYMRLNSIFMFLVGELQTWNKKIAKTTSNNGDRNPTENAQKQNHKRLIAGENCQKGQTNEKEKNLLKLNINKQKGTLNRPKQSNLMMTMTSRMACFEEQNIFKIQCQNMNPNGQPQNDQQKLETYRKFLLQRPKTMDSRFKKDNVSNITPFSYAEFSRNMFVYTSLKTIMIKKPNQIERYLHELEKWYGKNSQQVPAGNALVKPSKSSQDQEWDIRKTFKSNTPLEISSYVRRYLCGPSHEDRQGSNLLQISQIEGSQTHEKQTQESKPRNRKNGSEFQHYTAYTAPNPSNRQTDGEREARDHALSINKIHQDIRRQREGCQIKRSEDEWKKCNAKFYEKTTKNFYKGKFGWFSKAGRNVSMEGPQFIKSKVKTAEGQQRFSVEEELTRKIKKGRIQTSLGERGRKREETSSVLNVHANEEQLPMQKIVGSEKEKNEKEKGEKESKVTEDKGRKGKSKQNRPQIVEAQVSSTDQEWIDQFKVEEPEELCFGGAANSRSISRIDLFKGIDGISLISNPFDASKQKMMKERRK